MRQQLHGSYVIYSDGRIYSTHKEKFLKPYLNDKGYQKVRICENGSFKMWTVHRLVATMFLKQEKGVTILDTNMYSMSGEVVVGLPLTQ